MLIVVRNITRFIKDISIYRHNTTVKVILIKVIHHNIQTHAIRRKLTLSYVMQKLRLNISKIQKEKRIPSHIAAKKTIFRK